MFHGELVKAKKAKKQEGTTQRDPSLYALGIVRICCIHLGLNNLTLSVQGGSKQEGRKGKQIATTFKLAASAI